MARNIMMSVLIIFLMACSKQLESGKLIHEGQTGPNTQWMGKKSIAEAYDNQTFEDLWNTFNIEKKRPHINWGKYAILFTYTLESSCPKEISRFQLSDGGKKLTIETTQKGSTCDDIGLPKSFVFQIEKEKLSNIETISFEGKSFDLKD
ncbi:hypothetical protein V7182_00260 [Neobacillus drentensis]|uniref:hypothetical protein n=1 Tax=Neobacillus drentensis TaxID=220684 RepID=UPI002FFF09AB